MFFYWPGLLINIEAQSCFSATAKKKKETTEHWIMEQWTERRDYLPEAGDPETVEPDSLQRHLY